MKIGTFIQSPDGHLLGRIHGLGLVTTPVSFEPQTSKDGKSYYRLIADPTKDVYEIGVAFPKEKYGKTYYTVSIDSPMFPAPVNATLLPDRDGGAYDLVWTRQEEGRDLRINARSQYQPLP